MCPLRLKPLELKLLACKITCELILFFLVGIELCLPRQSDLC